MIFVTRKERFNAAHKLFVESWSNEKNLAVFGKCSNPNWHGHSYELFVTIKGEADPVTGFVMDLKVLSSIIREKVIEKVDHKNINLDVDFMKDKMPSTEVLAMSVWEQLEPEIARHGCSLHCVKLYETENNFVEYFGK